MSTRNRSAKALSSVLILVLIGLLSPVSAGTPTAELSGTILSADEAPLAGAKIYAADTKTGKIYPGNATGDKGRFSLTGLPASSYELGVELEGGLYVVDSSLALSEGQSQNVNLSINTKKNPNPSAGTKAGVTSVWNNPFTAALIVLGSAAVVGVLVESATDDEDDSSPF